MLPVLLSVLRSVRLILGLRILLLGHDPAKGWIVPITPVPTTPVVMILRIAWRSFSVGYAVPVGTARSFLTAGPRHPPWAPGPGPGWLGLPLAPGRPSPAARCASVQRMIEYAVDITAGR